ncbi:MAG: TonB-dependent receptor [Castellaniella sp.]
MSSFSSARQGLAFVCCALPLAAGAQTDNTTSSTAFSTTIDATPRLETVVVTPARDLQLESKVVGDVGIIDRSTLEQAGQTSLAELLARQPGIQIYGNGGPQTITGVFVRGANPAQSLVMLDGLPINSSMDGGVSWNVIDPALIDRVEIVRGAASSLYGSSAMGGVINIISREPDAQKPLSAWGNAGVGSNDTFKSSVGVSGSGGAWDYAVSSFLEHSGGFNASRPESGEYTYNRDRDGYDRHGFAARLGHTWAPGQRLELKAFNAYINGQYDDGPWTPDARVATRQQAYAVTSRNRISEQWESILRFGFTHNLIDSRDSWPVTYRDLQRTWNWQNNFRLGEHHHISTVLERKEERLDHSAVLDQTRRNTNAAGLIWRGEFNALRAQASVRHDRISDHGGRTTGSLGLDYDLSPHWTVGASGSTGFRLPGFDMLYWPGYSNPGLRPEKSRSVEARIRYTRDAFELQATAYQSAVRDLILNDDTGPVNIGRARIRGLTLTAAHQLGATRLAASADFMDSRDRDSGEQLVRRARQVWRLNVNHRVRDWDLGAELQVVGKRFDNRFDDVTFTTVRETLGAYGLVNLSAVYTLSRHVDVQLRWNNVFNKDYVTAWGYNNPGSTFFLNLAWRL